MTQPSISRLMNDDLFLYKTRFLTFALLLGYVFIHVMLTGSYVDVTLVKELDFTARLPFGQRLLVPALAHWISIIVPLKVDHLFFLMEWLFVSLFYFALVKLLEEEFSHRQAQLLSWLFLLLLPLMTIINYRFTTGGEATFFYPYDTASLFFLAVGFLLCLREQWLYLIPWIFLATFNRESTILLVLLIPALHWQKLRSVIWPLLFAVLAYVLTRSLVLHFLKDVPGDVVEWYFRKSAHTYFEINLYWLFKMQNILLFLFCFAGLPLFWFAFYDYIPMRFRPLRYVALFYFIGLLFVGNFMEARLFTEIVVLLYLPVCIAVRGWLLEQQPYSSSPKGVLYFVDRYFVLATLVFIILFCYSLNQSLIWCLNYF